MSMISKQIDELRDYAKDRKGELAKLINDAADTIEVLSAKLYASNMERSSQYYNDGWISVDDRLPENDDAVLISHKNGVTKAWWNGRFWTSATKKYYKTVLAWMPLPEPYKPKENEL